MGRRTSTGVASADRKLRRVYEPDTNKLIIPQSPQFTKLFRFVGNPTYFHPAFVDNWHMNLYKESDNRDYNNA